jgi:hypothetical protein
MIGRQIFAAAIAVALLSGGVGVFAAESFDAQAAFEALKKLEGD